MHIQDARKLINNRLADWYSSGDSNDLTRACWYALDTEGRRWRPVIMLAVAEDMEIPAASIIEVAACFELLHSASLILDDLPCMDNAMLRRGKHATHIVWGEDIALLAYTDLVSSAVGRIAMFESTVLHRVDAKIARLVSRDAVLQGQFIDLQDRNGDCSWEERTYLKNGIVFETMLYMVTDLASRLSGRSNALGNWPRLLGTWHQAMDDLYDVLGRREAGGKPIQKDDCNNLCSTRGVNDVIRWVYKLELELLQKAPGLNSRQAVQSLIEDKRSLVTVDAVDWSVSMTFA